MTIHSDKTIVNLAGVSVNLSAVSSKRVNDDPGVFNQPHTQLPNNKKQTIDR